jgi:hypothetical protein
MPAAEYRARLDSSGHYDTFGKPAAGVSEDLDALAAYITSLDKVPRSPFRNSDGSFTAKALAGRKIFRSAECGTCHVEPDFTDSAAGALHDVGTILPTSGTRLFGPLEGIDTPSLKGVWATAPYLHDGRAATLTEIFTKHLNKNEMGKTSGLDETQLAELVEYLQELDDVPETLPAEPPPQHHGLLRCSCRLSSSTRAPGSAAWFLAGPAMCAIIRRRKTRRHVPRA